MAKSQSVWTHNSFIGQAVWTRKAMAGILKSPLATPQSKALASEIEVLSSQLEASLRKGPVQNAQSRQTSKR